MLIWTYDVCGSLTSWKKITPDGWHAIKINPSNKSIILANILNNWYSSKVLCQFLANNDICYYSSYCLDCTNTYIGHWGVRNWIMEAGLKTKQTCKPNIRRLYLGYLCGKSWSNFLSCGVLMIYYKLHA